MPINPPLFNNFFAFTLPLPVLLEFTICDDHIDILKGISISNLTFFTYSNYDYKTGSLEIGAQLVFPSVNGR